MAVPSYAKINLYLKIGKKLSSGYHNLQSVMQRIELSDNLVIEPMSEDKLIVESTHPELSSDENLAYKAALLLKKKYKVRQGAKIHIEKNIPLQDEEKGDIFLAQLGDQARRKIMKLFEILRKAGFNVRQAFAKDGLKGQLEMANRMGVKYTLILGQKEVMDGTILIRDMESGVQEVIDFKKTPDQINDGDNYK